MKNQAPEKSGKFILRTTPELHQELSSFAAREGRSLNDACNLLLARALRGATPSEHPFLQELIRIFGDRGLRAVVLFGSVVRGMNTQSSDVDLLLVMDRATPIVRALYREWDDDRVSLHFSHQPQVDEELSSFWLEVLFDGKILWNTDPLWPREWERLRAKILEGAYTRKQSHGHYYWVKTNEK